jgi:hypothetical protein
LLLRLAIDEFEEELDLLTKLLKEQNRENIDEAKKIENNARSYKGQRIRNLFGEF